MKQNARPRAPLHICAFVHTRDEQYGAVAPFLREGLERGEKAVDIVDPSQAADHVRALEDAGVDVDSVRASGQLEIRSWDEVYLRDGTFCQDATLASVEDMLRRTRDDGYPRTRIVGCLNWAAQDRLALDDLVEYEAQANDVLARYDAAAMCVYDGVRFPTGVMRGILHAHPMVITGGETRRNPFFVSPDGLIAAQRKPERVLAIVRERYLAALEEGSRRAALEAVVEEGLWREVPIPSLYLDVVQPALYEIGDRAQQGQISVAQARLAIETCSFALAHLQPLLPSEPSNGKRAVVASVEGERHDLGARMVADFLDMAGFGVRFLGADVPTETLVAFVEATRPELLVLSTTLRSNLAALRRAVTAVRRLTKPRVAVAAGGQAFAADPGLAQQVGVDLQARDAATMLVEVRRLLQG